MFKAAKAGAQKVITANRLDDGRVVFLEADNGWTLDIAAARVIDDSSDLEAALTYGKEQHEARVIIDAYAIDVIVGEDGVPVPVRLREKIRADRGPTTDYGDSERARLKGAA